ncbi:hypothetical protein [Bdellovibrio sp. HCB288]|uniref:hypothetical protein n=1 Tax=Bdellovibrio sp. HCB288 TaxID=3394355 RepID=UPI0039B50E6E
MFKYIILVAISSVALKSPAWSIMDATNGGPKTREQLQKEYDDAINSGDAERSDELWARLNGFDYTLNSYDSLSSDKAPQTARELCKLNDSPYGINQLLANADNRMAFTNLSGDLGTGLCWWHSSLTRSAAMLSIYQPDKPRPNKKEAERIIDTLIAMNGIVTIPGFSNWREFSEYFSSELESKMSAWQRSEALNFGWLRGLKGTSKSSEDLRANLELAEHDFRLYKKPVYAMLQFAGPMAHSWLILDIKKTETGFRMFVLDSNTSTVDRWDYQFGQESIIYPGLSGFIPYVQPKERQDLFKLQSLTDKFCKPYKK